MTWFNELLRSPPVKSAPEKPPGRPQASVPPPVVDIGATREALATVTDDGERRRLEHGLGCTLAGLLKEPLLGDGPHVWAAAACHVGDKSLALQWISRVDDAARLGEIAVQGRFAEVRLAAAQRIGAQEVLEQVARLTRGRDKGVFRHCSDVLRQRRQAADRVQRTAHLAAALRELLTQSPLSVSCLLDLQQEVRALDDGSEPVPAECSRLLDQANERLGQESEARRLLQSCRVQAEQLRTQCAPAAWPGFEPLDAWRAGFSKLAQVHAALPPWLADRASSQTLAAALHDIEARLTALASEGARIRACEQFLSGLPGQSDPSAATAAWDGLPKPDDAGVRQALQARWEAVRPAQQPSPPEPPAAEPEARQPRFDTAAVRKLLEQVEQALEQGHLAEADAGARKIKATLGSAPLHGSLASRLQRALARLTELSGWAKWGAGQKRGLLIAAAEELRSGSLDVDYLARAIPALREEWKQLNGQATPAPGEWERFDGALEKAYQPVAARRAEEAAQRSQARAARETLCAQWEAAASAIVWDQADYAAIEAQRQQMMNRWRALPRAGFRDERVLRKRFDAVLGGIDQRLTAARADEMQRREQLIGAAEALREAPDLRGAITEAKALQERWRQPAGPLRLPRAEEQKLWQRFRAACDAVFTRRDAQRAEQVAQQERRKQERVALVEAFAAALAGEDPNQIKRALGQFRADWDAAKTGAAESAAGLEQRVRDLQQRAQRRIEALQRDAYRTRLEALARQTAPAEGLEADALAAGRQAREAALIDLEIALDLPTPDAFADARRRRQLERLQSRFRAGEPQRTRAEDLLARFYASPASPDPAIDQRMAAVIRKLIEQRGAVA